MSMSATVVVTFLTLSARYTTSTDMTRRGPRPESADTVKAARLQRELDRANRDLANARKVIEVQGKVSALLEELLSESATETDDGPSPR
jgi:hypothetical protein